MIGPLVRAGLGRKPERFGGYPGSGARSGDRPQRRRRDDVRVFAGFRDWLGDVRACGRASTPATTGRDRADGAVLTFRVGKDVTPRLGAKARAGGRSKNWVANLRDDSAAIGLRRGVASEVQSPRDRRMVP